MSEVSTFLLTGNSTKLVGDETLELLRVANLLAEVCRYAGADVLDELLRNSSVHLHQRRRTYAHIGDTFQLTNLLD